VGRPSLVDGQTQRGVGVWVAPPFASRHCDFSSYAGEDFAPPGVFSRFFALDGCPFAMSRHVTPPRSGLKTMWYLRRILYHKHSDLRQSNVIMFEKTWSNKKDPLDVGEPAGAF
jgi:hypothetical protein